MEAHIICVNSKKFSLCEEKKNKSLNLISTAYQRIIIIIIIILNFNNDKSVVKLPSLLLIQ